MSLATVKAIRKTPTGMRLLDEVFDDNLNWGVSADIDYESAFMGDGIYEALAKIIPTGRIIYDFGASYGIQSWLFRNHKKYIAIQPEYYGERPSNRRFRTDNSIWFCGTIKEFFNQFSVEQGSFAICNAVPSAEVKLVRENCKYLYVNYPEHCDFDINIDKAQTSKDSEAKAEK